MTWHSSCTRAAKCRALLVAILLCTTALTPLLLRGDGGSEAPFPALSVSPHTGRMRHDVVLALASGPLWEGSRGGVTLARFAGSLRGVTKMADIVLMVDLARAASAPLDVAALLRVSIHFFHSSGSDEDAPPSLLRWRVFSDFLETHAALYSSGWAVFADAAEAVFQRDPFQLADAEREEDQLLAFLEVAGDSSMRLAAKRCYPATWQALEGEPAVAAGIVVGTFGAALELSRAMTVATATLASFGGAGCESDVPVLNAVLRRETDGGLSFSRRVRYLSSERGPVQSLVGRVGEAGAPPRNARGQVVNAAGEVSVAVHHLTTSPAFVEALGRQFPAPRLNAGIEPIVDVIADIRAAFLRTPRHSHNQQTLRNYVDFAVRVRSEAVARGGCRLLIFGLGHDSPFIARANSVPGSETVFVESSAAWLSAIQPLLPPSSSVLRAVLYAYNRTRVADTDAILALGPDALHARLWMGELPADVTGGAWDVVLVDAPPGYSSDLPGRLQPLYTASMLVRRPLLRGDEGGRPRHVYVHDCDRESETAGVAAFFAGVPSVVDAKLLHLVLPL